MTNQNQNLPIPGGENVPDKPEKPKSDETLEIQAPQVGEQSETTRLERKKKLTLKKEEGGETGSPAETVAVPSPADTQSTVLQDPTRRRETNTASLKRLRPVDIQPKNVTEDPDNTETVNIRVIKEQKKQFRNMMTASQTLAVDSQGVTPSTPSPAPAPGETLKVKAPVDTRTESIARQATPGVAAPSATAETSAPSGVTASPKATLKIKAPPALSGVQTGGASAPTGGPKPGATLKIKAPAPAAAGGVVDPSARTVKQEVPPTSGPAKTLKLKQPAPASATAAAPSAEGQEEGAEKAKASVALPQVESEEPSMVYTLCSVISTVAAVMALIYVIRSNLDLFQGIF